MMTETNTITTTTTTSKQKFVASAIKCRVKSNNKTFMSNDNNYAITAELRNALGGLKQDLTFSANKFVSRCGL